MDGVYARTMLTEPSPAALRRMRSPIGRIEVIGDGSAIVALSIERDGELPHDSLPESPDPIVDAAIDQLEEYFHGTRRVFDLPVSTRGTTFQSAVWQQISRLGWGEIASYGELGRGTGRATAGRAVGGAVGANPIPIIVPCHRILGSGGMITGYSGGEGIPTKSWLLAHEGIPHRVPHDVSRGAAPTLFDTAPPFATAPPFDVAAGAAESGAA